MAEDSANHALVAALAPICVQKIQSTAEAPATLVALKKIESWEQDTFIVKGGWATFPGESRNCRGPRARAQRPNARGATSSPMPLVCGG